MISLWSIAQMVLELLDCPFVHGQLWRKIRKKTKRVREWSIFPSIQAFDYGAIVRSFPACWEPRNGSSWKSFSVFLPFVCYFLNRSEKLVKCEREICVKFTPVCCITITKKIPICLSVLQNEKKILAMQNVHFKFYMITVYCIQNSSNAWSLPPIIRHYRLLIIGVKFLHFLLSRIKKFDRDLFY